MSRSGLIRSELRLSAKWLRTQQETKALWKRQGSSSCAMSCSCKSMKLHRMVTVCTVPLRISSMYDTPWRSCTRINTCAKPRQVICVNMQMTSYRSSQTWMNRQLVSTRAHKLPRKSSRSTATRWNRRRHGAVSLKFWLCRKCYIRRSMSFKPVCPS